MKQSRFTDSQIMDALKRVEAGLAVKEICRELGISTPTFYKWREKYGGMDVALLTNRIFVEKRPSSKRVVPQEVDSRNSLGFVISPAFIDAPLSDRNNSPGSLHKHPHHLFDYGDREPSFIVVDQLGS